MSWIQTFSGRRFFPLDPAPWDVDIVDIAHALSMKCRYGGHTKFFFSVAQHSVLVAEQAEPQDKLAALLHDAHEAYSPFGDVPRPVKNADPVLAAAIAAVENRLDMAVAMRFGLPYPFTNSRIKALDNRILMDERASCMASTTHEWGLDFEPLHLEIEPWSWRTARERFLEAFNAYDVAREVAA